MTVRAFIDTKPEAVTET